MSVLDGACFANPAGFHSIGSYGQVKKKKGFIYNLIYLLLIKSLVFFFTSLCIVFALVEQMDSISQLDISNINQFAVLITNISGIKQFVYI